MTEHSCPDCKFRFLQLLVLLIVLGLGVVGFIYSQYQRFSYTPVSLPQEAV